MNLRLYCTLCICFLLRLGFGQNYPNILFIIADDASMESFGAYGNKFVQTPHVDRLASEGVLFREAFANDPKCSPARSAILTGRYPWQEGELANHFPLVENCHLFFPSLLEDAGYEIGYTGKGLEPADDSKLVENPCGKSFNVFNHQVPTSGISKTDYTRNFESFLSSKDQSAPFFFWMGIREPHRAYEKGSWLRMGMDTSRIVTPGFLPNSNVIKSDLADYYVEIEWLDQQIGRTLKLLEANGILDSTIIIFTSDNGMPFPGAKGQVYEDGYKIPFIIRWGPNLLAGKKISDFLSTKDFAPTILSFANVEIPTKMSGINYQEEIMSKISKMTTNNDQVIISKDRHDVGRIDIDSSISVGYPIRAIRKGSTLLVKNFYPNRLPSGNVEFGIKDIDSSPSKSFVVSISKTSGDFYFRSRLIQPRPALELYDLSEDPHCLRNLLLDNNFNELAAKLGHLLFKELSAQLDPRVLDCGEIFDYYPYGNKEALKKVHLSKYKDPELVFEEFIAVYPSSCLDTEIVLPRSDIVIYPNPFMEEVNFLIPCHDFSIEIFSLSGQLLSKHKNQTTLDMRKFEPGLYLCRVSNSIFSETFRLVKQ